MTKTRRYIEKTLPLVDLVVEVADARVVRSSQNPDFDRLMGRKPRIAVLTKTDLADEAVNRAWARYFQEQGREVLFMNCVRGQGVGDLLPLARRILSPVIDRVAEKGMKKTIRLMICGIPNSGKSTLINTLCGRRVAEAQDRPGVTRGGQWVRLQSDVELLDTPGILWNKFDEERVGMHLAMTGAINDRVFDREGLTLALLAILKDRYPKELAERFKINLNPEREPLQIYEEICRKRGFLLRGGDFDYTRCAAVVMDEFRGGKIGRISLEAPDVKF